MTENESLAGVVLSVGSGLRSPRAAGQAFARVVGRLIRDAYPARDAYGQAIAAVHEWFDEELHIIQTQIEEEARRGRR